MRIAEVPEEEREKGIALPHTRAYHKVLGSRLCGTYWCKMDSQTDGTKQSDTDPICIDIGGGGVTDQGGKKETQSRLCHM